MFEVSLLSSEIWNKSRKIFLNVVLAIGFSGVSDQGSGVPAER